MRTYTIAELVQLTDVPPATIHYYLRQGLLPHPKHVAPNRFAYDERHVQALRLVRMLREQRGLPLPMIRRIMPELSRLEAEEAFRPEMWDRALAPRISRRPTPSARLLEAAKDAFARRGYGEVNVDDICRAARIAKGSFYRHYRSKEELFIAVVESVAEDVISRFADAAEDNTSTPTGDPGSGIEPGEAGPVLAGLLEPRLPVFLELFARSIQTRQGYPEAARRIFGRMTVEVGRSIAGLGTPESRGMAAIGSAVMTIIGQTLGAVADPVPARDLAPLQVVPAVPSSS